MSLARESVAARCVTSSIASRTDTAPLSLSIREIASDGARSPARHCTRIARTSGGSIPSVRRVIASASSPARVVMAAPGEGDQQPAARKYVAQAEPLRHIEIQFNERRKGKWPQEKNLQVAADTEKPRRSASKARCAAARKERSSPEAGERLRAGSRRSQSDCRKQGKREPRFRVREREERVPVAENQRAENQADGSQVVDGSG